MDTLTTQIVGGLVRHALTAGGGALAAKGLIDPAAIDPTVGAIATIVGLLWSIWVKLRTPKAA